MSLHKNRAEEILDLCLSNESPQMRAKVYEIINQSGLLPNDPLFLVLALTGQMRVFLETAPVELKELLSAWKNQNKNSLREVSKAIASIQEVSTFQIEKVKQSLESVNAELVKDVQATSEQTIVQIVERNAEVEKYITESIIEIQKIKQELETTRAAITAERNTNIKVMKALIEGIGKTNDDLEFANDQLRTTISVFRSIRITKIFNKWVMWGWFFSSVTLIFLILWKK